MIKKVSVILCIRHHQTRISRNFSARHIVNTRFRVPFHYRLIKQRFAAVDRRTREKGTRGFGVPDTPAGLRSYATRLGKRVCQNAFFHFCPHGPATDCNCCANSNTSIHSATSYSSSVPALSLYCLRFDYIRRQKGLASKKSVATISEYLEITPSKKEYIS